MPESIFKQEYDASIAPVVSLIRQQFQRAKWSGKPIQTHSPATEAEMGEILTVLRAICPVLPKGSQLKIDSGNINKYPALQKLLDNHSRGSAYMRQFFKLPLQSPCDCVACQKGLFSPLVMPAKAYVEIPMMPLPIPKPVPTSGPIGDLHYMSMEQASQQPFTDEHQPSVKHRAANRSRGAATGGVAIANRGSRSGQNKMYHSNYVRGVVECKDCLKPRVLFSLTAPSRMVPCAEEGESAPTPGDIARCREYALHQLEVAQESEIYTCGMQPFDSDHPFHEVIYARKELLCSDPMEVEYYTHTKQKAAWFDENLCAYCAGVNGEGFIDKELLGEWKSLLPVCQSCRDEGAPPLVRSKKRNGAANSHAQQRRRLAANAANERAAAQQQQQNVGSGASGAAASSSEVAGSSRAALQPRNMRRGRQSATAPSPPSQACPPRGD